MSHEREQGRADAKDSSPGVMRLFGQMMLLPFTVFVYGMDLFVRTIQGMQRAADQGMDVMAGGAAPSPVSTSAGDGQSTTQTAGGSAAPTPAHAPGGWSDLKVQTSTSSDAGPVGDAAEVTHKETGKMSDKDLNDDQLKLVRYKILFVKRDYEVAFPEREELVHDNIRGEDFTAWKIAEFIQRLDREEVPERWRKKDYLKHRPGDDKRFIHRLEEDDKKFLRVYYEVLERYVREEDDSEVDVLKDIRKAIDRLPRMTYGAGEGAGGGTGGSGGGEADGGSSGGGRGY
jgi:hypothetical protein